MPEHEKALIPTPKSAVAAASTIAERARADRAQRALAPVESALPSAGRILVVDKADPVAYPTITAAVAAANEGDRVLVRPGHYQESVILDKAISVEGDGERDAIVVEGPDAPAFVVTADGAGLSGLTLEGEPEWPANDEALTEEEYHQYCCLAVSADATVAGLVVRAGDDVGINLVAGRSTVRGTEVHDNRGMGIWVTGGASAEIKDSRVRDNGTEGISVSEGASATIEGSKSHGNFSGIAVLGDATSAKIVRTEIHDNWTEGIVVSGGISRYLDDYVEEAIQRCAATIEDTEVYDNRGAGIKADNDASVTIQRSKVHHNSKDGINIQDAASATLKGNEVYGNSGIGIDVAENATATLSDNSVYDNAED